MTPGAQCAAGSHSQSSPAAGDVADLASVAALPATIIATRALLVLSLVDSQRASIEIGAVERLHGTRSIRIRHLHEAETARAARFAIGNQG